MKKKELRTKEQVKQFMLDDFPRPIDDVAPEHDPLTINKWLYPGTFNLVAFILRNHNHVLTDSD